LIKNDIQAEREEVEVKERTKDSENTTQISHYTEVPSNQTGDLEPV
jgi:hypothetical protein